jgi:glucose uptake protein GlcU
MSSTGWMSAFISCIAFGSFAVPVKVKRARECNVDPLVFQSYKTFMCFITSFLTIPIFNVDFNFTPYGIVSGIFWVPAGVAAIYAVQNAGLAVSQGLWSSIIVLVSFTWGIFFFMNKFGL